MSTCHFAVITNLCFDHYYDSVYALRFVEEQTTKKNIRQRRPNQVNKKKIELPLRFAVLITQQMEAK